MLCAKSGARVWHNSIRMPLYLGIDGGGTKTSFAVADDTHILARVTEGGSSPTRIDEVTVQRTLRAGIESVCAMARVRPGDIDCACVGSAGVAIEAGRQLIERTIGELIKGKFAIVGDMLIAHEAAFFGSSGVMVVSGTGSIAFGVNDDGENARAGGRGPIVSDEGSGTWIGRKAVSALLTRLGLKPGDLPRQVPASRMANRERRRSCPKMRQRRPEQFTAAFRPFRRQLPRGISSPRTCSPRLAWNLPR